jgi:hypothetical protein
MIQIGGRRTTWPGTGFYASGRCYTNMRDLELGSWLGRRTLDFDTTSRLYLYSVPPLDGLVNIIRRCNG